ncbi:MAG: efflux RND transporter periplasmic adaptor subunit [Acidobacteria bacterium]|nr:efflux RND transporter periplasmic adaptor subunit [Acidobacteriota bacterium]
MKNMLISLVLTALLTGGFLLYFASDQGAWLRERLSGEHQLVAVISEGGDLDYWTCTMHPSVKMKEPGKCPICAMDLVQIRKGSSPDTAAAAVDESLFMVDPRRQQLLNVQTTTVERRPLEKVIRTVATLELDETQIRHVNPKIRGWIEKVFVNFTLQHVEKGDPLFSVYSPELVSTQEEYLLAVRMAEGLSTSSFENVTSGARSLLEATRRRLLLLDITEEQIRALEKTGKVQKSLTIYSPATGHVIQKNAFENMYVTPDMNVYTVADHSRIWAKVEIYENEIPYISEGQAAVMTVPAAPGETFRGKVSYVYPHLDARTRTMKARLEFPNPDLKLKPGMYANIDLRVPLGRLLAVPYSAVLRTGTRDLVFVDLGNGQLQLRRVEIGAKAGDYYEVLKGLRAGEKVISAANFLIDAESKVQGVIASWETPKPR